MLSDRIQTILEVMDVSISDVAKAGGCTPSNLNRVKNGVRTPPASSPTIRSLTGGLMVIAEQRHMKGRLAELCGAELRDSDEALREKLIGWLFEDEPPYVRTYKKRDSEKSTASLQESLPSTEFAKRLDGLMQTAGLSNRRLGFAVGLDPSYISRLRRGERMPKYQSPYLIQICRTIFDRMAEGGKLPELSAQTCIPQDVLTGEDGADELKLWLFGYEDTSVHMAANELIETIGSVDRLIKKMIETVPEKPGLDEIISRSEEGSGEPVGGEVRYIGIDGLRTAVTRFLADMISCGESEMLLYSDQSMEWMGGEYRTVLTALMSELVRRDVKVSAIHTVSRSLPELVSAVEWWMPLYLSGRIRSYYCTKSVGRRFSHTLFIRPGAACIAGTSVTGLESRAIYSYSQDDEVTDLAEEAFSSLLQDSLPLVEISECSADVYGEAGYIQTDNVLIKADSDQVIIGRAEPPYLMFRFTHPMIVRAFRAYMNS